MKMKMSNDDDDDDDDRWKMSDGSQSPYTIILKCDCGVYYMSWHMIRCMTGHGVT